MCIIIRDARHFWHTTSSFFNVSPTFSKFSLVSSLTSCVREMVGRGSERLGGGVFGGVGVFLSSLRKNGVLCSSLSVANSSPKDGLVRCVLRVKDDGVKASTAIHSSDSVAI
jgi:hypothetical protein